MNTKTYLLLAATATFGAGLGACGGDEAISVDQPWARATVEAQPHGAVYLELTVDHDDVLVGASIEPSIADHAEIHEVVESDVSTDDESAHDEDADHGGMAPGMVMRQVEGGLELVADETVVFAPGDLHVMLLDLVAPLEVGDEFDLTLEFDNSDDVTITVPVEETAP